jgi:hypothetical protein
MRLFTLMASAVAASAQIIAISFPGGPPSPVVAGTTSVPINWIASFSSAVLPSEVWAFPYVNGLQWGAEVPALFTVPCSFTVCYGANQTLFLPPTVSGKVTLFMALQPPPVNGPTVGRPPPKGAVMSNALSIADVYEPRGGRRVPSVDGSPQIGVYFETWFTPANMYW